MDMYKTQRGACKDGEIADESSPSYDVAEGALADTDLWGGPCGKTLRKQCRTDASPDRWSVTVSTRQRLE